MWVVWGLWAGSQCHIAHRLDGGGRCDKVRWMGGDGRGMWVYGWVRLELVRKRFVFLDVNI